MTLLSIKAGQREPFPEQATIFIVDHDPEARETVCSLVGSVGLNAEPYVSADDFLENYDPRKPGCLILEVILPGMTGLELQRRLAANGRRIPIIFTTSLDEVSTATKAMRAGASDFFVKPFRQHALLESIHQAIGADQQQHRRHVRRHKLAAHAAKLTNRQREVMQLLACGASTKTIASRLNVSPKTVDNHRAAVMEKMGVRNIAQLIRLITEAEPDAFGVRTEMDGGPRVIDRCLADGSPITASQHVPTTDTG